MRADQERIDSDQESIPYKSLDTKAEQTEGRIVSSAAADCQKWVMEPGRGQGSPKHQIYAAEKAFRGVKPWRIRDAFYGHAGSWGVDAYLQLRGAYERWKEQERARQSAETRNAIEVLSFQRQSLASADPLGNQAHIAALDCALVALSRED